MEVKGVTLEQDGRLLFPDAPTERGVKHIKELIRAKEMGYGAAIVFVVQADLEGSVSPNRKTHPEFADSLVCAQRAGVKIICVNCKVEEDGLEINREVPLDIDFDTGK